jgi:serine/threonine protein kinase
VFLAVLEQPPERRLPAARSLCADSAALFDAVRRLLAGHEEADGLFGPPPQDPPPLPRRLGAYLLVEEIGRGGMGAVYRAERADGQFEKQVAVKVLAGDLLTPRSVERFRKERQILAGLEHPYIARLLDGGVGSDGCPYIVMEYVDGLPVDRYCRERSLSVRQTVELAVKICSAVEYAHTRGIVHRDIKPGNLIVTADGTPKLLDFGISLDQAGEQSALGEERTRALTPHYASPEQLAGGAATPASDIYSLGILFQDLLAGPPPAPARRIARHLRAIVARAAASDPAARYASGRALREALDRYLGGTLLARSLARFRWQVAAALLVTCCVAGAIAALHHAKVKAARKVEAIRAIRSLFWDTQARISGLPDSRASQRHLIRQTESQLDALGRDAADDPALLYELALSYSSVAFAQGASGYSVGDFPEAARGFERAITWGQRSVRRSGTALPRMLLAGTFSAASNTQLWNSEFAEAERLSLAGQVVLDQARTQLLHADSPFFYRTMITLLEERGEAVQAQGRLAQSAELWLQADALADRIPAAKLKARDPRIGIRIMLAVSNCEMGNTEAGAKYAASAETLAQVAARLDPRMSTGSFRKAGRAVAECDLMAGRIPEARAKLEAIRKDYHEALLHDSPGVRTGLADADRILGNLLLRSGDLRAAAAVYQDGLEVLSSPPDFAATRIAESNRADLLAGRGRLEQLQASAGAPASPAAERYWRAACEDYRGAEAIFREWAANRGMYLSNRLSMADVERELPKCSDPRGLSR